MEDVESVLVDRLREIAHGELTPEEERRVALAERPKQPEGIVDRRRRRATILIEEPRDRLRDARDPPIPLRVELLLEREPKRRPRRLAIEIHRHQAVKPNVLREL